MSYPPEVFLTEVGPRDGLQNEMTFVPTAKKVALINALSASGLQFIEATSFVSARAIPQLADSEAVIAQISKTDKVNFSALIPNTQGMRRAISAGIQHIALFTAASDTFNQHNIQCSTAESMLRFKPVLDLAKKHHCRVRAYISCALGCPYEGSITPHKVLKVCEDLLNLGIDHICLGDTIGVGTPKQTKALLQAVSQIMPYKNIGVHFHDTYGQAIANIVTALELDVRHIDSAVAGLGGCPYARGASGNVATEDVLYLMHGLGVRTGVDIYQVVQAGQMICAVIGRKNQSKVATALLANGG